MSQQPLTEATVGELLRRNKLNGLSPGAIRNHLRNSLTVITKGSRWQRSFSADGALPTANGEIVIDATRLVRRTLEGRLPTGIDRTTLAYVDNYKDRAHAMVVWLGLAFLLPAGPSRRLWRLLLAPTSRSRVSILVVLLWGAVAGLCSIHRARGRVLINTSHSGLEDGAYPGIISRRRFKPVFLIHDLIPISHPEYCRAGAREQHVVRIRTALDHAAALITNSKATLRHLTDHANEIRASVPAIVAAPLAPGLRHAAPGARPIDAPYFLILGTIEPRKNHWLLLQVWRQLAERLGPDAPKLVIIGSRGWECENVVDLLERCEPLKSCVIEHSECSDHDLSNYLHHARALLFPSFAEGYGMPLIEALSLRVPVVVSDLPVFREIGGDIPEYIDPLDAKRWAEVVTQYADPKSRLRKRQITRMNRFRVPTWSEHFAIVDELIGRLNARI